MFDFEAFDRFLTAACTNYEKSAPLVERYLDGLYIRMGRHDPVSFWEVVRVYRLKDKDGWIPPALATNTILHIAHAAGIDTSGWADF